MVTSGTSGLHLKLVNDIAVVAIQDQAAGTFSINGGDETLVYSYDISKDDVSLSQIGTSTGRIHLMYTWASSSKATVITFDLVDVPR